MILHSFGEIGSSSLFSNTDLFFRWDICNTNGTCEIQGLAYIASACVRNRACTISEDVGIPLGILIAHEIGHILGCPHDKEGGSACPAQNADESFFLMAPLLHMFTTTWSICSRAFITAFFEHTLDDCLSDRCTSGIHQFPNALPGTIYDGDTQCDMLFPNSSLCATDEQNFCKTLMCQIDPESCISNGEPPADGTKCGPNKWCFHKQCISMGQRPEAVQGGWGPWGNWSSCTRTCGGGISVSERECNNPLPQNKGRYCIGQGRKYKICNTTPCPTGTRSFREQQCSEKDHDTDGAGQHTWKPYYMEEQPCVLYCINENGVLGKLAPSVIDGTPCRPGSRSKCISGICTKIGCDNQIDSDATEDICGVCNGDGTECKIVDEVYKDVGAMDYKKVATIPSRARSIRIEELAPSVNAIALSDNSERHFYLNGDHKEQNDGPVKIDDLEGFYSHPEPGRETLIISGPLKQDVIFFVCFYDPQNVGYRYTYAEANIDFNYTPRYHWELLEWSQCSVNCGGGIQTSNYQCVEDRVGKVSNNFCNVEEKPEAKTKKCNEKPCKIEWKVGKWSSCSGHTGLRLRRVECVEESPEPGGDDIIVEDEMCKGSKPASREICNINRHWKRRCGHSVDQRYNSIWPQIYRHLPVKDHWTMGRLRQDQKDVKSESIVIRNH